MLLFRKLLPAFLALFLSPSWAQENLQNQIPSNKKVVFIIVDGIAADMLKAAATPNLDAIAKEGAYTDAAVGGEKGGYSETPTISAVGYNSLLTGTWVNKHNVFGNSIKNPNYSYPTIFRLFKDQYPDRKTAIFSTWEDNRTKLLGAGLPQTHNLKVDYSFDGFELDTVRFPHDQKREYIRNIDQLVATEAAQYISEKSPDLSWVYLEFSDDMGHGFGDSPQLMDAIHFEDSLVGHIYNSVKKREKENGEDWLLLVTTDHGRSPVDGRGHGGQTDRERGTWIVTNSKNTNAYFKKQIPAIVDLTPTMARFLSINPPEKVKDEWDGVPILGPVDAIELKAEQNKGKLKVSWKDLSQNDAPVTIYGATSNDFKTGGSDNYIKLGTAKLKDSSISLTLKAKNPFSGKYIKILFKSPNTTLNTWITE